MAKPLDRILILGLDGATWTVLGPMIDRGAMPNLKALVARSRRGVLRSTIPPVTSAAWTTMMTGCDPWRHGVFDHRWYDAEASMMRVNHSERIRVPTLWHLLSRTGRTSISLNVPATYPPPRVKGIVVSGMDAPHLEAALSGAPEFAARLRKEIPGYHLKVTWKRPPQSLDEIVANAGETAQVFEARARGGLLADEMLPDWSALMVQFQNLDPFQHRVWKYLNVDETGIDEPAWNRAAESVMTALDRACGMLCELAEKRGAGVMVVSDHGFGPCLGRIDVNRILIDKGVARLPGLAGKLGRRVRQARDRLRLWNAKSADPLARSASFEASIAGRYPLDWKRTLAFAPHQDTAAMIYMNTTSRHPKLRAAIATAAQLSQAMADTMGALSEAKHPETGARLFPKVIDTAREYGVDPEAPGYPDIIALPDEMYWVRTKLEGSRQGRWVLPDPNLPGTHRPEGVVILAAPDLGAGPGLDANLRDACPTALALLGMTIPAHIEGRPIVAVDSEVRARCDEPMELFAGSHAAKYEHSALEQELIERRLADLGYME